MLEEDRQRADRIAQSVISKVAQAVDRRVEEKVYEVLADLLPTLGLIEETPPPVQTKTEPEPTRVRGRKVVTSRTPRVAMATTAAGTTQTERTTTTETVADQISQSLAPLTEEEVAQVLDRALLPLQLQARRRPQLPNLP